MVNLVEKAVIIEKLVDEFGKVEEANCSVWISDFVEIIEWNVLQSLRIMFVVSTTDKESQDISTIFHSQIQTRHKHIHLRHDYYPTRRKEILIFQT